MIFSNSVAKVIARFAESFSSKLGEWTRIAICSLTVTMAHFVLSNEKFVAEGGNGEVRSTRMKVLVL